MKGFLEILQLSSFDSIDLIVWSIFFGIVLACLLSIYEKRYVGNFVRAILKSGADTKEKAKTLDELGIKKNVFLKNALRGKSALSTIVFTQNDEVATDENGQTIPIVRETVDLSNDRFYIPENRKDHAAIRFDKNGTHIMACIIAIIVFAFIAVIAIKYVPVLIEYLNEVAESL